MLENFLTVAQNVLTLFILMGVGFCCQRFKLLNDTAVKACANLVLYFATPCVIIKSCIREFDASLLTGFLIMAAVAIVNHAVLITIASRLFRDKDEGRRRVLRFATIFSNAGYMGIPLQQAILGDEGVFYCAAYVIVFNITAWTYGVLCMSGDKRALAPKKLLFNPGIIGVVIGMALFLLPITVPKILTDAVGHLATLNTPIPMIIVGYYMAQTDLLAALKDKKSYLCLLVRLVGMPLLALGGLLLVGVRGALLTSCMICICAPVATMTTMFSTRYERDTLLSVNLVSVSTLLAVVTMPLMIALTQYLGTIV